MQKKKVKLMDIVIDPGIKVREINSFVQARYSEAYKAGAKFPPLIIDSKNRLVSGHHRYAMYKVNCDLETLIECEVTPIKEDRELIILALRENATHGEPLRVIEKQEATLRLVKNFKMSPEKVAEILNVRIGKIEEWAGMYVHVIGPKGKPEPKPVKIPFEYMIGQTVKEEDYNQHRSHDYGVKLQSLCNQIISIIRREKKWISDEAPLRQLYIELENYFEESN